MTSASPLLRSANESDLPFILDLFNDVIANTTAIYQEKQMSRQDIRDWWEQKKAGSWPVWIAEVSGEAVGFSTFGPFRARECYHPTVELAIHVVKESRGQGIGKRLLEKTIASAREQGFHSMMAAIDSGNSGSIQLHHHFGFKKVGEIKQVARKRGCWLDLTFMRLGLEEVGREREWPRIVTEHLLLRLPALSDIPGIIRYFKENENHLSPFDPKRPDGFHSETFWEDRIPKHSDDFLADRAVRLYLFSREDEREVVGALEFSQISRGPFQACYLGYGIAKKHEGRGFMHEALRAAIQYAFDELNLHRIMANHLPENERSARLLRRLGFQKECVAKEYLQINGAWRDHVLNSLRNPGWQTAKLF